jgi:hypothetical protein
MVGRLVLEVGTLSLSELSGKALYNNKRDAFHSKHHAQILLQNFGMNLIRFYTEVMRRR